MTDTMKRWELSSYGISNLELNTVAVPSPAPGEILVEVEAVSLNYRDQLVAADGHSTQLLFPFTPASDMSGRVIALGEGVTRFAVGESVISSFITGWIDGAPLSWEESPSLGGPLQGMLTQYVAIPAHWCVLAPETLTPEQASTLPIAAVTPWMALFEHGKLLAGETVVVQGTGGVSLFAIQFAAAKGARVIVTSSSDEKIARAKEIDAVHGISRGTTPDWHHAVRELTGGLGADHVLEMASGESVSKSVQAVAAGGRISIIGLLESHEVHLPIMSLLGSRASITAIAVGPSGALEDVVQAVDQYEIKPVIDAVYHFEDALLAFEHLKRGAFGKIVIQVRDR